MKLQLVYDQHAVEDLKLLSRKTADRITAKIAWFLSQNNLFLYAQKLKPPLDDLYRFRIGEYRAIFEITRGKKVKILVILRIKHRKDAYE